MDVVLVKEARFYHAVFSDPSLRIIYWTVCIIYHIIYPDLDQDSRTSITQVFKFRPHELITTCWWKWLTCLAAVTRLVLPAPQTVKVSSLCTRNHERNNLLQGGIYWEWNVPVKLCYPYRAEMYDCLDLWEKGFTLRFYLKTSHYQIPQ